MMDSPKEGCASLIVEGATIGGMRGAREAPAT